MRLRRRPQWRPRADSLLGDVVICGPAVYYSGVVPARDPAGQAWPPGEPAWYVPGVEEPLTTAGTPMGPHGDRISLVIRQGRVIYRGPSP